nr:LisH domain-containing protein armc9 [Polyrhizophydium stewartii]
MTITYLQNLLKDLDTLSDYTIEYGSALLMNLCLRTRGKQECAQDPGLTLAILNELIEHDNIQVKTYVNGALYSLLSEPAIREQARAIGMEEQLKYLRQVSDEQLVKQIDFVIEKLTSEEDVSDTVSEDGEEDDTVDDEVGRVRNEFQALTRCKLTQRLQDDLPLFEEDGPEEIFSGDGSELVGDALLETYAPKVGSILRHMLILDE